MPAPGRSVRSLAGLLPVLRSYRTKIALAVVFPVGVAISTRLFPVAPKSLTGQGFVAADPGERLMAMREHFFALFGVRAALGLFSALRFTC